MLGWLRGILGIGGGVKPAAPAAHTPRVQARYDNAQNTDENRRQWWMSDYLSAKSANNFQVRRQLRNRSRYEVSNNPYLYGVCTGNADDLISTGPTLQCKIAGKEAANRQIELLWREWCAEVDLAEKLRTLKLAKTVDGEGFLILKTVADAEHPVKLYPVDVEADQVTTPAPVNLTELWVDGLTLHPVTGRPVAYDVLKSHPGDYFFPNLNPLAVQKIKARHVIHWFAKFRPGQVRGVPVFTTALDLFTELRSYRKAILAKAQIAANLTAVLETEAPADADGSATPEPWDNIPIDRGTITTLPGGGKLHQYTTGEPGTTYEMFQQQCLGEAVRPLSYPLNLALGTSQKFNFSSARLDHINYRNALTVERAEADKIALNRLFRAWLEEAALVGILPAGVRSIAEVPHEWHWPGFEPLDPVADAAADHARLSNGTVTWQQFWASRGYDWREVLAQQAAEAQEIERLGLVFGDPLKKTETETIDDTNDASDSGDGKGKPPGKGKPAGKPGKGKGGDGGGDGAAADRTAQAAAEAALAALRGSGADDLEQLMTAGKERLQRLMDDLRGAKAEAEAARLAASADDDNSPPPADQLRAEWGRR